MHNKQQSTLKHNIHVRDLTVSCLGVFSDGKYFLWLDHTLPRVFEDEDLVGCRIRGMPLHVTLGIPTCSEHELEAVALQATPD